MGEGLALSPKDKLKIKGLDPETAMLRKMTQSTPHFHKQKLVHILIPHTLKGG